MAIPVVGLTGGIASGKSSAARAFAQLGVPVIDADLLAREVVAPGSEGLAEIVASFGTALQRDDGTLDRKALGARVFSDAAARERLNAITHPRIAALAAARIAQLSAHAHRYVIYEAPLLVENNLHRSLAGLVVVALDPALQLERAMARDGLTRAEAARRIEAQAPLAEKLAVADFVIDNGHDLAALERRVAEVHGRLCERFDNRGPQR